MNEYLTFSQIETVIRGASASVIESIVAMRGYGLGSTQYAFETWARYLKCCGIQAYVDMGAS